MRKVTCACHARDVLPCPVISENRASGWELGTWNFSLSLVRKVLTQLLAQTEPNSITFENRASEYEGMLKETQVNL